MKTRFAICTLLNSVLVSFLANSFLLIQNFPQSLFVIVPLFIATNIVAGISLGRTTLKTTAVCRHGTVLLYSFYGSLLLSTLYHIALALQTLPHAYKDLLWSALVCIGVNFIVFWNGILCIYLTSTQLGLKLRVLGLVCGMIPIANLVVLFFIIKTTTRECLFEMQKEQCNRQRKEEKRCATKYPLLLVHGVFFRDTKFFNYWGRIPKELQANGATVFYGNHSSAASIADSAAELAARITEILAETGAEKVNIIAHSKGGLDCRYAISKLGIGERVASLTTINTPHRGCEFADCLLSKIPTDIQDDVANTYNATLKKFGETNPDFLAAVNDLTASHCTALDSEMITPDGIYCQSVGSVLTKAKSGKFPLNFSYRLVNYFSGANDGLVSETSFQWGEKYTLLTSQNKRGISHGDMIDLNRENIPDFDVREFYVTLVNDLKQRGL